MIRRELRVVGLFLVEVLEILVRKEWFVEGVGSGFLG